MENIKKILSPLLWYLRSRKGVLHLAAILVSAILTFSPDLKVIDGELFVLVTAGLTAALMGTVAMEDMAQKARNPQEMEVLVEGLDKDIADLIRDAVEETLNKRLSTPKELHKPE